MADTDDIKLEIEKIKIWKNGNGAKGAEKRIQENNTLAESARDKAAEAGRTAEKANERIDDLKIYSDESIGQVRKDMSDTIESVDKKIDNHEEWHKGQAKRMNWFIGVVVVQLVGWVLREFIFPVFG